MDLEAYQTEGFHDELFDERLEPRAGAELLAARVYPSLRQSLA